MNSIYTFLINQTFYQYIKKAARWCVIFHLICFPSNIVSPAAMSWIATLKPCFFFQRTRSPGHTAGTITREWCWYRDFRVFIRVFIGSLFSCYHSLPPSVLHSKTNPWASPGLPWRSWIGISLISHTSSLAGEIWNFSDLLSHLPFLDLLFIFTFYCSGL